MKWLAGLLVGAGLVAGALGESAPVDRARRTDGYWILAGDFHVHAFAGDGALAPWPLRREIERAGLDVFGVTNHNQTFTARVAERLADGSPGPIVIAGEEITARGFHLIAIGIDSTVDADQSAADAIQAVHAQGGVAIAAHPGKPAYADAYDDRALALLDGFERAHPSFHKDPLLTAGFVRFQERVQKLNPGIAFIGSSDFHTTDSPGWCRTYVLARERSAAGVIDAIRDGRTVAADIDGNLYGDPQFVRVVQSAGGYVAAPRPPDRWRTFSVWSVWLGLLGMLTFARSRQPLAGSR